VADHGGARAGWYHYWPGRFFEDPDRLLGDRPDLLSHPGIEGWLPAAGLPGWDVDFNSQPLEHLYDGFSSLGVESIQEAGDKQVYVRSLHRRSGF
jgi:hypothetical protein